MRVLIYNCEVYGGGSEILIEDGIIKEVGEGIEVGKDVKRINLGGSYVLPGMIDAHMHFWEYSASFDYVDLRRCNSVEEALERIKEAPPGIVIAFGWDEGRLGGPLTRELLDKTKREVVAFRSCMHVASLSTKAIKRLCKEALKGSSFDEKRGIFKEDSMETFLPSLRKDMVKKFVKNAKKASEELRKLGLSVVTDMGISEEIFEGYFEISNELRTEVVLYLSPELAEKEPEAPKNTTIRGVKLYADGSLGGRTAALFEPYSDDPENSGILVSDPLELRRQAERFSEKGYQIAIHAIGDRGVWAAVNALKGLPNGPHRIEHCQLVREKELKEMRENNIIVCVQPIFINTDRLWAKERLGERIKRSYPLKSLLDLGIKVCIGTDAPIESPNPFYNLYAAVYRKGIDGRPEEGFRPEESISLEEGIKMYTEVNSEVLGLLDRGKIAPGYLADLLVIPKDIFEGDLRKIRPLISFSSEDFKGE